MAQRHGAGPELPGRRARSTRSSVKWLPGIAAESRNFDANGQYVRSLRQRRAATPTALNDGRFFLTGLPLQGVNPPKADTAAAADAGRAVRDPAGARPAHRRRRRRRRRSRSTTTRRRSSRRPRASARRPSSWLRRDAQAQTSRRAACSTDRCCGRRSAASTGGRRSDEARDPRAREGLRGDPRACSRRARRLLRDPRRTSGCASRSSRTSRSSAQGRVRRPRRPSRRARARPSASPASGSATSRRSALERRPGDHHDGPRPRSTRASSASDWTALLRPEDRPEGHVHRAQPGREERARDRGGRHAAGLQRRCPTSTRTSSSARSTPTRATTSSCCSTARATASQGRGDDLNAGAASASSRPTATSRAVQHEVAKRRHELRAPHQLAQPPQRRARPLRRRPRGARRRVGEGVRRVRRGARQRGGHRPRAAVARCATATRRARQGRGDGRRCSARRRSALRPVARALRRANKRDARRSRCEAAPLLRDDIRPFVREARPLVRELQPVAARPRRGRAGAQALVPRAQPPVQHARLQPERPRGPAGKDGRDEGYLFYLAWLAHQSVHALLRPGRARRRSARSSSAAPATRSATRAESTPGGALHRRRDRASSYDQNVCGGVGGMNKEAPSPLEDLRDGRRSRCRASACCCSCG